MNRPFVFLQLKKQMNRPLAFLREQKPVTIVYFNKTNNGMNMREMNMNMRGMK